MLELSDRVCACSSLFSPGVKQGRGVVFDDVSGYQMALWLTEGGRRGERGDEKDQEQTRRSCVRFAYIEVVVL
jgi:hypothetical protein